MRNSPYIGWGVFGDTVQEVGLNDSRLLQHGQTLSIFWHSEVVISSEVSRGVEAEARIVRVENDALAGVDHEGPLRCQGAVMVDVLNHII